MTIKPSEADRELVQRVHAALVDAEGYLTSPNGGAEARNRFEAAAQLIAEHVQHLKRNVHFLVNDAIESPTFIEAKLKAKLEVLEKQNEWQPISTFPDDGQKQLLGVNHNGKWYEALGKTQYTNIPCGFREYKHPTHWQHLPQPPKQQGDE